MSGDALFKELTGAKVMVMEQDVPALRNMRQGGKEHPMDRILKDGDTVELGGSCSPRISRRGTRRVARRGL